MPRSPKLRRKSTFRERMLAPENRRSRNIEDRRGEKVLVDDESDKYPPVYPWPPPMSEDINDPLETYSLQTHVPIYQARRDLATGIAAARDWLSQRYGRRKQRIEY